MSNMYTNIEVKGKIGTVFLEKDEIDRETFTKSRAVRDKPIFFPKTGTKIPFEFKFDTWLLKQKYKFRNFKEIYIKKTVSKWGQPLL